MASVQMIDIPKPVDYNTNPERYKPVTVVVVSDTHNEHGQLQVPDGDIFLHCGDFTRKGDWRRSTPGTITQSTRDFNQWLGTLPHRHKIVICGNHEYGFAELSKQEIESQVLTNCHYLKDELIEVEGVQIYGCPWSFTELPRSKWPLITPDIDILMTHGPPVFVLDLAYQPKKEVSTEGCFMCNNAVHGQYGHWGSRSLAREIRQRIKPKVHCFGHVHDDQGYKYDPEGTGTLFINAATALTWKCFKFTIYVDLEKHQQ